MPAPPATELTAEAIVDVPVPRDVRLSPDGRLVAWSAGPRCRVERWRRSLWIAPADGSSPPRRMTAGAADDRAPRFTADGRALLFLSDRERKGEPQLYRLAIDGGEAERLTGARPGLAAFAPLGDHLVALVSRDAPPEDERPEGERDDARRFGDWSLERQRLRLLDLRGGEPQTVDALGDRHVAEVAAAPDGDRLAVLAWPTPELDHMAFDAELHVVDAGGAARFVADLPSGGTRLVWSGDGVHVVADLERGATSPVVWRIDATTGQRRALGADLDANPIAVAPTSGAPLAALAVGVESAIARVGGGIEVLARLDGELGELDSAGDGTTLACVLADREGPEVWAGPAEGPLRRLSDAGAPLRGLRLGAQERLAWSARDGLGLDGILVLPVGSTREDGPFPLVTLVHGGPYGRFADELQVSWADWAQWLAGAGIASFLPNPRGGMGHGAEFARCVNGRVGLEDWADIERGLDFLIAAGVADGDRLGIGGWSQGGFMTAWAIGHTQRFRAAVMGAGVSDWGMMVATADVPLVEAMIGGHTGWDHAGPHQHDALSPISYAAQVRTPVLIVHGEQDKRVPVGQARYFALALRAHGAEFELVVYPREPHSFEERAHQLDLLGRVRGWFADRLLGSV